ncbi:acetyl-CoA synthetase-like protein [Xylaria acuta]|nr:acetyl-CoA synthetase-like protein [Xylaria acuta]
MVNTLETYIRFLGILSKDSPLRLAEIPAFDEALISRGIKMGTGKTIDFGWPSKQTVAHRVDDWALSQPSHIAVKDTNGKSLKYNQMSQRVNSNAISLDAAGVSTGASVDVFCEPMVDLVCCILAFMKLGAAYVALDVRDAPERPAVAVQESLPAAKIYHRPVTLQSLIIPNEA